MFKLSASCPNSCPQPKSPLINHLINDRLLNAIEDIWHLATKSSLKVIANLLRYTCAKNYFNIWRFGKVIAIIV